MIAKTTKLTKKLGFRDKLDFFTQNGGFCHDGNERKHLALRNFLDPGSAMNVLPRHIITKSFQIHELQQAVILMY